jgi:hypothetical protein
MAVIDFLLANGYTSAALTTFTALVFVALAYLVANEVVRYNARLRGIPGPIGLPVIGNLHQVCTPLKHTRIVANISIAS